MHNYEMKVMAYLEDNIPRYCDEFHIKLTNAQIKKLNNRPLDYQIDMFTTETGALKPVFGYSLNEPPPPPPTSPNKPLHSSPKP
jgi:hypothetical protein